MTATRKTVTIIQGDYAVSADPDVIMSTVLGSCVAVCLYDPYAQVGGMNHFLLAGSKQGSSDDLKYGVNAMELLINHLLRTGAQRHALIAKMFGGARMTDHSRDIGKSNVTFARDFLRQEGIKCLSESLGGDKARRLQFTPTTGTARQMQISGPAPDIDQVKRAPRPAADIMLF